MRENTLLIEKSFADAIAMIAAAEELPEEKRRHWATSLRQVADKLLLRGRGHRRCTLRCLLHFEPTPDYAALPINRLENPFYFLHDLPWEFIVLKRPNAIGIQSDRAHGAGPLRNWVDSRPPCLASIIDLTEKKSP